MTSDGCIIITHYQKAIKKARNDETKLLHCIEKLFEVPVTIDHLQRTGVGKTVNSLRKYNGKVGTAAKNLVSKWKAMVATEEVPDRQDGQKVVGDGISRNNIKEKNCEFSPVYDIANGKQSMSECVKKHSHINQRNLHNQDRAIGTLSINSSMMYKQNDNNEKSNHESRKKEKKHKSRHVEKDNSKSKSSLYVNDKRTDEDVSSQSRKNNTLSNGSVALDSSERCNELLDISKELVCPKAKKPKIAVDDGIDSSMGASFSDALGMCSIARNKKHKKISKYPTETKSNEDVIDQRPKNKEFNMIPDALKTIPQSKIDISLNLPLAPVLKITDNYKPAPINPNVMNCIFPSTSNEKATLSNAMALSIGISSKTMRTKVYSGVRTGAILQVPSLFDICIRVLQKNIDALEYTGGVPFDVLRPVLERTTPQQLLSFEDYNAYLLDDTDILWQQHVGRHFRGEIKQEGETWREMFLRCEDAKERRLSILTKNIKISQKQSALPLRKTRLAYVDNVAKPPRSIQRKQEQFGTTDKLIVSPAARVAALSSASHNTVKAGDPRLKIARDLLQSTGGNQLRSKKAPLMAKTLQFIKKRYKR